MKNKIHIYQIFIMNFEIYFSFSKIIIAQFLLQNNKNMLG